TTTKPPTTTEFTIAELLQTTTTTTSAPSSTSSTQSPSTTTTSPHPTTTTTTTTTAAPRITETAPTTVFTPSLLTTTPAPPSTQSPSTTTPYPTTTTTAAKIMTEIDSTPVPSTSTTTASIPTVVLPSTVSTTEVSFTSISTSTTTSTDIPPTTLLLINQAEYRGGHPILPEEPTFPPTTTSRNPREASELSTVSPYLGYRGSASEIEFIKQSYDKEEDARRSQAESSINQKLAYANYKEQEGLRKNFNNVFFNICNIQRRQLTLLWSFMLLDPTLGIRIALNREDITAKFVGAKVLMINKCSHIPVKKVFKENKINGSCYEYTPIESDQDEIFFILPGTRDLSRTSPLVECGLEIPNVYENDQGFFSVESPVNVSTLPGETLEMTPKLTLIDFKSPNFYESIRTSSFPTKLAVSFGQQMRDLRLHHYQMMNVIEDREGLGGLKDSLLNSTSSAINSIKTTLTGELLEHVMFYGGIALGCIALAIVLFCVTKILFLKYCLAKAVSTIPLPINHIEEAELPTIREFKFNYERPLGIYAVTSTGAPHVPVRIKNRVFPALWDSGSSVTYVSKQILETIGVTKMEATKIRGIGVGQHEFNFLGSVRLPLQIGEVKIESTVLVADDRNAPSPMLIGTSLMKDSIDPSLTFQRCIMAPTEGETTKVIITNSTPFDVTINALTTIGESRSLTANLAPYCPKELQWDDKMPTKKGEDYRFITELNLDNCKLSPKGKRRLKSIIEKRREAFFTGNGQPGCFKGPTKHKIVLDPAIPLPKPQLQLRTPWIQEIITTMESNVDSPVSRRHWRKYSVKDGMLNAIVPEDAIFPENEKKKEEDMKKIWSQAKNAIEQTNQRSIDSFKRHNRVHERVIERGDLVVVKRAPPVHKLAPKRDGPFRVTNRTRSIVTVQTPSG
ncbi:hypothetical protein PFISCL1PPCAC_16465, partial [Pristionchus fissidentatus]